MAEAIALGASVFAFIQVADRVISVAKYYIEAIHDCPREIRVILVEISSLKAILENLTFLLDNDSAPETYLLQQLTGDLGPIRECQTAVEQLEKLLPSDISTARGKRQKISAAVGHLAWPLRETKAKKLLEDISRYKATIVFVLTSDSMSDIKGLKKDVRQLKETLTNAERNEICTWLECTNPSSNHNSAWKLHEKHTSEWMVKTPQWKDWLDGKIKFLWIHGIPGAGKTIMASFLIEQAITACNEQNSIPGTPKSSVCEYYYCYFGRNQDEAVPFLQWLVGQLCRQAGLVPNEVDRLFQLKHMPNISQLLNALALILEEYKSVRVIIDAVDESQPRDDLLKVLRDLATDHRFEKIRLVGTSREYLEIEICFTDISSPISMVNPAVEGDIRRYVHSALEANKRFKSWPEGLLTEVENALARGAKGMFRWAVCQIDVLQRLKRQEDVEIAIKSLPKTLDETYERIFQLVPEEDHQFVHLALLFFCGNNNIMRPMPITATVLLRAVAFRLENTNDPDNVILYDIDTLRDRCGCLISFSTFKNEESIALAHYTVKEFLNSDRIACSKISQFALSESLVQNTSLKTVSDAVIRRYSGSPHLNMDFFDSYCILVSRIYILGSKLTETALDLDKDTEASLKIVEFLATRSRKYLEDLSRVFREESAAIIHYNSSAVLELES